jgi:hypothetical protein
MPSAPIRYRVALNLTPEEYVEARPLVQRLRRSGANPHGSAFNLTVVLHLALASGLYDLAARAETSLDPSDPDDEPTPPG